MKEKTFMTTKRFLPLFLTQFLGAFNDNLFRTSLITMITFQPLYSGDGRSEILVPLALAIFILPFFLFSATAGQIADRMNKARLIRFLKFAEIVVMALAIVGFLMDTPYFLLGVLFLMGTQSAFFGPVKYSIIPDHLHENELLRGNGLIEAATFIAILLGTILGGILISRPDSGLEVIAPFTIGIATLGYITSMMIPKTKIANPKLKIKPNIFGTTHSVVKEVQSNRPVFLSILGISWFWLVGSVFLSQIPVLTRDILQGTETVFTLLLTVFSFGIGAGSIFCHKLLKNKITPRHVPTAIFLMTVFVFDLSHAIATSTPDSELVTPFIFLSTFSGLRMSLDLFIFAFLGGIFTIPLYSLLQVLSETQKRSQVIAANNIMNALFMVLGSVAVIVLIKMNLTMVQLFLVVGGANLLVSIFILKILPEVVVKNLFKAILKLCFRVEIKGMENYHACQDRTVIIANHTSYLDAILLSVYLPDKVTFAINTQIAEKFYVKPFLKLVKTFPVQPSNPMSTKSLIELVKKNQKIVIFPEGRITTTGALMKVYSGPSMIADKTDAQILPIRFHGAHLSIFSRLHTKYKLKLFPKIVMEILPAEKLKVDPKISGRERRDATSRELYKLMTRMLFTTSNLDQTLFESLLEARKTYGGQHIILQDASLKKLTYNQLITRVYVFKTLFERRLNPKESVGLLLPNVNSCIISFFALQASSTLPVMLNFLMGTQTLISTCKTACVKTILTSRKFIKSAELSNQLSQLEKAGLRILYLEDLKKEMKPVHLLRGFVNSHLSGGKKLKAFDPNDPAVILFTSGSEGTPKAVVLSHQNLQANRYQIGSSIDFTPSDKVFNALPIFHSFGLTGGLLLPILSGVQVFLYPSPLHYKVIPELIYETNATIMFGTDTFLSGYARFAHQYDFHNLRYVFAGAERLKEETRRIWADKYGVRIFQGYGATETSPVIAMNTPIYNKIGTVGLMVPGMEYRLKNVPGIEDDKLLQVKGPNVMKGYFLHDKPGHLIPPKDGWYDTGDLVSIDEEGFVSLCGRVKRFAKIGGEMISLSSVERYVTKLWPGCAHGVISVADKQKGEKLILFTEKKDADLSEISQYVKEKGLPSLSIPKQVEIVDQMPRLGTGKIDYPALKKRIYSLFNI